MTIRILDGETINQIAAGEVIERPANALKELLENAADSGATKIEIDFDGGGKKEIKVVDDGCGIPADQVALALERHATSKIKTIHDLDILHTFGFRGEALSSLAAVSELTLNTSLQDSDLGTEIIYEGGKTKGPKPAAPVKGTHVRVKNIFYNIPARLKFLKSDAGETAAVKKVVKSFALIHPELHLTLRQGGKVINHWERETFKKRAQKILAVTDEQSVYVKSQHDDLKFEAVLALPQWTANTQGNLHFFVKHRPVQDRTMLQATLEGYRNLLMQHQYPQAVIAVDLDSRSVDINVHPAKAQVKFLSPGTIFRLINSEIKKALEEKMGKPCEEEASSPSAPSFLREAQVSFMEDAATIYNQRTLTQEVRHRESLPFQVQESFTSAEPYSVAPSVPRQEPLKGSSQVSAERGVWSSVQVIGQYANTYIVGQSRKALVLIDQHAAHERVLFERLKKNYASGNLEKQSALLDEMLELPREAIEALTTSPLIEIIEKMGFDIADRGPTTLSVSTRPAFLIGVSLQPLFEKLADQALEFNSVTSHEDLLTEMWASMSCHGAIRAGRVLTLEEMRSLLIQMDEFSFSHFCPHGRPVSVNWDIHDLEKLFRRIV